MTMGFTFAGRVIDYFGSKAITSNNTAIIELIKNSRDANSTRVDVDIIRGTIQITDNGDGMDFGDIKDKWMVIGTDSRIVNNKTRSGRAVWGEMGIGRIACHKLGNILEITTVKKNQKKKRSQLPIQKLKKLTRLTPTLVKKSKIPIDGLKMIEVMKQQNG